MRSVLAVLAMVVLASPVLAGSAPDPAFHFEPGSLLVRPSGVDVVVGIATQEATPVERRSAEISGSGDAESAGGDATGHIVTGPNKSTTFKARHYSGSIHHSSYQQLPWTGVIWHHIEWGPSKSLYTTN